MIYCFKHPLGPTYIFCFKCSEKMDYYYVFKMGCYKYGQENMLQPKKRLTINLLKNLYHSSVGRVLNPNDSRFCSNPEVSYSKIYGWKLIYKLENSKNKR